RVHARGRASFVDADRSRSRRGRRRRAGSRRAVSPHRLRPRAAHDDASVRVLELMDERRTELLDGALPDPDRTGLLYRPSDSSLSIFSSELTGRSPRRSAADHPCLDLALMCRIDAYLLFTRRDAELSLERYAAAAPCTP